MDKQIEAFENEFKALNTDKNELGYISPLTAATFAGWQAAQAALAQQEPVSPEWFSDDDSDGAIARENLSDYALDCGMLDDTEFRMEAYVSLGQVNLKYADNKVTILSIEKSLFKSPKPAIADVKDIERCFYNSGRWHHGNGALVCGTLRIAVESFDTDPVVDLKNEVFDYICNTLNKATIPFSRYDEL